MNAEPYPFPHMVIPADVVDLDTLRAARNEMPPASDPRWRRYGNDHELKLEGPPPMWGPATSFYFDALADMAELFAAEFDLPELHMETIGGGYHLIPPGGYLDIHTDFSRSPDTGRYRRLNVLAYLNDAWTDNEGGHLELWDDNGPAVKITPEFGTIAAFVTSATSWHGHPTPTTRWRASLAAYFFTDTPPEGYMPQSTVWHPNGGRRG